MKLTRTTLCASSLTILIGSLVSPARAASDAFHCTVAPSGDWFCAERAADAPPINPPAIAAEKRRVAAPKAAADPVQPLREALLQNRTAQPVRPSPLRKAPSSTDRESDKARQRIVPPVESAATAAPKPASVAKPAPAPSPLQAAKVEKAPSEARSSSAPTSSNQPRTKPQIESPVETPVETPAETPAETRAESKVEAKLADTNALAASAPQSCPGSTAASRRIDAAAKPAAGSDGRTVIEADHLLSDDPANGETVVAGNVVLEYGRYRLQADQAAVDRGRIAVKAEGNLTVSDGDIVISGDRGALQLVDNTGQFDNVAFLINSNGARGTAGKLELHSETRRVLTDSSFTLCPAPGDGSAPVWQLKAENIELDAESGRGIARDTTLQIADVPVLYLPYLDFPIDDRRKSGFLYPTVGNSDKHGFEVVTPYYWNIAPNADLTLTPRLMSKRGLMLENEARYLLKNDLGLHRLEANLNFLVDDDVRGDDRHLIAIDHDSQLSDSTRLAVNFAEVSDVFYFEDFGSDLSETSGNELHRSLSLSHAGDRKFSELRIDDYQTINPAVITNTYQVLPRFRYSRDFAVRDWQLFGDIDLDIASFNDSNLVKGWRFNARPSVSFPFLWDWGGITETITFDITEYDLDNIPAGIDGKASRALPIISLDGHLVFDRLFESDGQTWLSTLTPRAKYLYVPRKNQSAFPVFDSALMTGGYDNLFRDNRFAGGDRIGDANQLSLGLSHAITDFDSGRDWLRTDIGGTYHFQQRREQLPGVTLTPSGQVEYAARIQAYPTQHWLLSAESVYDTHLSNTTQTHFAVQYRGEGENLLSLRHRYQQSAIGNTELAARWELNPRLNVFARYDYSHRRDSDIESLAGLEYSACCWAMRVAARSYVTSTTGLRDDSIYLEFELKGLTGLGENINSLFDDRIETRSEGYSK